LFRFCWSNGNGLFLEKVRFGGILVTSDGGMETDTIFDKESVLCLGLILGGTILTEDRIVESLAVLTHWSLF
jgi:hypothetical protein